MITVIQWTHCKPEQASYNTAKLICDVNSLEPLSISLYLSQCPRAETTVGCAWPSSFQAALHEKQSFYRDKNNSGILRKPLSLNTIRRCLQKYNVKLLHKERAKHQFCASPSYLGSSSCQMDWETVEMCSVVTRVQVSLCFWEKQTSGSSCQRQKRPSKLLTGKLAKVSVMLWGRIGECILTF